MKARTVIILVIVTIAITMMLSHRRPNPQHPHLRVPQSSILTNKEKAVVTKSALDNLEQTKQNQPTCTLSIYGKK